MVAHKQNVLIHSTQKSMNRRIRPLDKKWRHVLLDQIIDLDGPDRRMSRKWSRMMQSDVFTYICFHGSLLAGFISLKNEVGYLSIIAMQSFQLRNGHGTAMVEFARTLSELYQCPIDVVAKGVTEESKPFFDAVGVSY